MQADYIIAAIIRMSTVKNSKLWQSHLTLTEERENSPPKPALIPTCGGSAISCAAPTVRARYNMFLNSPGFSSCEFWMTAKDRKPSEPKPSVQSLRLRSSHPIAGRIGPHPKAQSAFP